MAIRWGKVPVQWGKVIIQWGKVPILWGKIIFCGGKLLSDGGKSLSKGGKLLSSGGKSFSKGGKPPSRGGKRAYGVKKFHPIKISHIREICIPCQKPNIRAHSRHLSALPSNYSLSPLHGNITPPFIAFLHIVLIKSLKEAWYVRV